MKPTFKYTWMLLLMSLTTCRVHANTNGDARSQVFGGELVDPWRVVVAPKDKDHLHAAIIITNLEDAVKVKEHLNRFFKSLLKYSTGTPLHFLFITDEESVTAVEEIVRENIGHSLVDRLLSTKYKHLLPGTDFPRSIKVEYVNISAIAEKFRRQIDLMKEFYGNVQKDIVKDVNGVQTRIQFAKKYRMDLFYIAPFYADALLGLDSLLVLDADLELTMDLSEIYEQKEQFTQTELFGLAPEFTDFYKLKAKHFLKKFPEVFKHLSTEKLQGVNTGVVLYNLNRIREAKIVEQFANKQYMDLLEDKYKLKGSLAEQDWFTLLSWEEPQLFFTLPCQYNHQTTEKEENEAEGVVENLCQPIHKRELFKCNQPPKVKHTNIKSAYYH